MCGSQFLGLLLEVVVEELKVMWEGHVNTGDSMADVWVFSEMAVLVQPLLLTYTR